MRKKFLTAIAAVLCVAVGIVIGFVLFKDKSPVSEKTDGASVAPTNTELHNEMSSTPTLMGADIIEPTDTPVSTPTTAPTDMPTPTNTPEPTASPVMTPTPTAESTKEPTPTITTAPIPTATAVPTTTPTQAPTKTPTPTPKPTSTPTPTEEPTKAPTPTKEPTKVPAPTSEPTKAPSPTIDPNIDIDTYVSQLQQTHIVPFLNGYSIESRKIIGTGRFSGGNESFLVEYTCTKGSDKRAYIGFYTNVVEYNSSKVADEIIYHYIQLQTYMDLGDGFTYWDITADYENICGLANYLK